MFTLKKGPVAQLGARINRTDEVEGSNPSRSTGASPTESLRWINKKTGNMGP